MSDSTNPLNQVSATAIQREVTINENFAQASPAMIFGYDPVTSAGLTFGYMGGRIDGTLVAKGTKTCTDNSDNYIVAHRTTFAVTIATNTTNWNDTTVYGRLYKVTAASGTLTWNDERAGGIFIGGAGSGGPPTGAAGGHLGGTYPNPTLSATGIAAATALTEAPADLAYTGIHVSMTYGASLVPGDVVYFDSTGVVLKADANAAGKFPAMGMAMETFSSGSHVVLLLGIFRNDAYAFTVGGLVYLDIAAGGVTQTQPSATDDCIQVLGVATHADRIFFNPQLNYITHV